MLVTVKLTTKDPDTSPKQYAGVAFWRCQIDMPETVKLTTKEPDTSSKKYNGVAYWVFLFALIVPMISPQNNSATFPKHS